ncbi:glycoside hydrolase family 127 protein [Paenactinomyces guangxiensis]|uniref:Glycoside hydrolase family 127 protein n=1 Tax=Paenactinomyces guangxiensis TaxID=1490290 RepID=A0A7W1WP60_9BACL|nr:beta-L-arabinofuranosidase domain-containing protein [Paenactinomyces guangxiensis]MBA4493440.1 glycoside hydrolase family 127 protein [Paenactinomyces guangxiensis]MBH8590531.1 glycoside hydrolase family 127 protein [Paenactinomyces guangxiensis]
MDVYQQVKNVKIMDHFWIKYKKIVEEEVIPYQWKALNDELPDAEPSHAIENFRIAAGESTGEYYGTVFQDSDVAKWLETVSYCLRNNPNPELEQKADELIALLARAQADDGYLNTYYMLKEPQNRWTNLRDNHELYCAGHFIEAAVAYFEATGKTLFLNIVEKLVNLIDQTFGREPEKLKGYPGHEEIELALIKLFDVTQNQRYLKLAQYFIEQRGVEPIYFEEERIRRKHIDTAMTWNSDENMNFGLGYEYQQAHKPVREQTEAVGHAVRAMYLYIAMADLAAKTKDHTLKETCERLWEDVTTKKMYITGGIGSAANGEAFTSAYDLPNDSMYCETCASVGLAFWANRMLRLEANRSYADVLERTIYNGTISGMDLTGKRFFYVNPLEINRHQSDRKDQEHIKDERQKWFFCACCPPNLARMIASIEDHIYTYSGESIFTHLYIASEMKTKLKDKPIQIKQQHQYPWQGTIDMIIDVPNPTSFKLGLRIPGWCKNWKLFINQKPYESERLVNGYIIVDRTWQAGDRILLELAMPVEKVRSNPLVAKNQSQIALQRGPIVYCIEEVDNGPNLAALRIPKDSIIETTWEKDVLNGVVTLRTNGYKLQPTKDLYTTTESQKTPQPIKAIPYYAWCNRIKGEMRVWIYEG